MTTQTISQIFEDALLSQAAYADLTGMSPSSDPAVLRARLVSKGISESMAEHVSQNYRVVHQAPETASGYSATLFQRIDNPDTPDDEEGFVFAQRGTSGLSDMPSNMGIAFRGFARDQINDMNDYWQWIGTNVFQGAPPPVRVTGHSLGGHLATIFALGSAQVEHASTFNGAGIANVMPTSGVPASVSSFVMEALLRQVGYSGAIPNSDVSNVQASAGPEVVAGVNTLIGSVEPVFSEGSLDPTRLHGIANLTASLALHQVFSLIDSGASIADIGRSLEGATNVTTSSYERAAEMLVRTVQALDPTFSAPGGGVSEDGYDESFALIGHLQQSPLAGAAVLNLTGLDASSLYSMATGSDAALGSAVRFALAHGHSFAVHGPAYDAAYDQSNFTEAYLRDRGLFLEALLARNDEDSNYYATTSDPLSAWNAARSSLIFVDNETNSNLYRSAEAETMEGDLDHVIFGGAQQAVINGSDNDDRLYASVFGSAGVDLHGGAGDDYLQGGMGDDVLDGGTGVDEVVGGAGDDEYRMVSGDGLLSIYDSDGEGSIVFDGQTLGTGIVGVSDSNGVYEDGFGHRYEVIGDSLFINFSSGDMAEIAVFSDQDLGITLNPGEAVPTPTPGQGWPTFNVNGNDYTSLNWFSDGAQAGDASGEIVYAGARDASAGTYFGVHAGLGDSFLYGDAGHNVLFDDSSIASGQLQHVGGTGGDDYLDGGDGSDWLFSFGGDDHLIGGADDSDDILIDNPDEVYGASDWIGQSGHTSDDRLEGGGGSDWLISNGGNDIQLGGTGNDVLLGGAHDDRLVGGDGHDFLSGDTRLTDDPIDVSGSPGNLVFSFNPDYIDGEQILYGNDILEGDAGDDHLYGGGGDDQLSGGAGADELQGDFMLGADQWSGLENHQADQPGIHGADRLSGGDGDDILYGGGGDDVVHGGAGDDFLFGEWSDNITTYSLDPQFHGDDLLVGGDGADVIWANGGDDRLEGNADDDYLYGGEGDDTLLGGTGIDQLVGHAGKDRLHGGDGDDLLFGNEGEDQIFGEGGADEVGGGDGNDYIDGSIGNDLLVGEGGDDTLIGGIGADELQGGAGKDVLDGGSGDDILLGGAGDDTYVVRPDGGVDQLTDSDGVTTIRFVGIRPEDVRLTNPFAGQFHLSTSENDRLFMSPATLSAIEHFEFDDGTVLSATDIFDTFVPIQGASSAVSLNVGASLDDISLHSRNRDLIIGYAGGVADWIDTSTFLDDKIVAFESTGLQEGLEQDIPVLVVKNWYLREASSYVGNLWNADSSENIPLHSVAPVNVNFTGGAAAEAIGGSDEADTVMGGGGADVIATGAGDDTLAGGTGSDLLLGGDGNDIYSYAIGDGFDTLAETGGSDELIFGAGITQADLTITADPAGLTIGVGAVENEDSIRLAGWFDSLDSQIETLRFEDGTTLDPTGVEALITGNAPPVVAAPMPDQEVDFEQSFQFAVPSGTFSDPNSGDTLVLSAIQADGTPLPSWLAFDPTSNTFTGTSPDAREAGPVRLQVTATDQDGLARGTEFTLAVGLNGVFGTDVADALDGGASDDTIVGFAGEDVLTGGDGDDVLSGGDGKDDLFGEAGNDQIFGGAERDVIEGGLGADTIYGDEGNDILRGDAGDDWLDGGSGVDTLVGGDGDDTLVPGGGSDSIDGGAGSNTYLLNLGDGGADLTVGPDGTHRIMFGPGIDPADIELQPRRNGDGTFQFDEMDIRYGGAENPGDRVTVGDLYHNYLSVSSLGIQIDNAAYAAQYTFEFDDGTIVGLDQYIDAFLTGSPGDDVLWPNDDNAPVFGGDGDDSIYGRNWSTLDSYSSTDDNELHGEAGDDSIHGYDGNDLITGGAGDDALLGDGGADTILGGGDDDYIRGDDGNDYLEGNGGIDDVHGDFGNDTILGGAGNDQLDGGRGDDLIQGGAGNDVLVGGGQFDTLEGGAGDDYLSAGTGGVGAGEEFLTGGVGNDTFENSPRSTHYFFDAGDGQDVVSDIDPDNGIASTDRFEFVDGSGIEVGDLAATQDGDDLVVDVGGSDQIRFTDWFVSSLYQIEEFITYDASGQQVVTAGSVVDGTNAAPVANADSVSIDEDDSSTDLTTTLLSNDSDADAGDTSTIVSADATATLGEVTLDTQTGSLSYDPNGQFESLEAGETTTDTFSYTIEDAGGAQSTASVTVTVTGENDTPILSMPLSDQHGDEGQLFEFIVPVNTFDDVDGDTLSYTATLSDGSALPAWLSFDEGTRTFSGTPGPGDLGAYQLRVTATDSHGAEAFDELSLRFQTMTGTSGDDVLNGTAQGDEIYGAGGADLLLGNGGDDLLRFSVDENLPTSPALGATYDIYEGGAGFDTLVGTNGVDAMVLDDAIFAELGFQDPLDRPSGTSGPRMSAIERVEGGDSQDFIVLTSNLFSANDMTIDGSNGSDLVIGGSGDDVVLGGNDGYGDALSGGGGNDLVQGGAGDDMLGMQDIPLSAPIESGSNILQGEDGYDAIGVDGSSTHNVLDGGNGNDELVSYFGNDNLFAGGAGFDMIAMVGSSTNVILHNVGDDSDLVQSNDTVSDDTLSLGELSDYDSLTFSRSGDDLILGLGAGPDAIQFADWYQGSRPVDTLQVLTEQMTDYDPSGSDNLLDHKVETFDFLGLVGEFDAALAQDPGLTEWSLTNALASFHLGGSNTEAIGGDLAYQYGMTGSFAGIGLSAAQDVIAESGFATAPQQLRPLSQLQTGPVALA